MKKTDESPGRYATEKEDSLNNARAMMGWDVALEVEAPRTVTVRRGKKLLEEDRPAFVKIYTDFKDELADMEGIDLKVWIYLALSINRFTGTAYPGLRKIASDLKIRSVNTLQSSLERLEAKGLLDIEKEDGKRNVYRPADYASVSKGTVSKSDTVSKTVSNSDETVSVSDKTVSTQYRKPAQLEELDKPDILDGILRYTLKPKSIQDAIRNYFKLTPNWEAKYNRQFMEWAIQEQITPEQIQHAAKLWGSDKRFNWSHPSLKGIQEHWLELIDDLIAKESSPSSDPFASLAAMLERQGQP